MKIYVSHSVNFDYQNELYVPLKNSKLNELHELTLPHLTNNSKNSKECINKCDLVIAEVSHSATGQGIELGWADVFKKPIICVYKRNFIPPNSLKLITTNFIEYSNSDNMIEKLAKYLITLS